MPVNLSVKNVPDDVAERLRDRAQGNRRSLQGELLAILEESVNSSPVTPRDLYEYARSAGFSRKAESSTSIIRRMRDERHRR